VFTFKFQIRRFVPNNLLPGASLGRPTVKTPTAGAHRETNRCDYWASLRDIISKINLLDARKRLICYSAEDSAGSDLHQLDVERVPIWIKISGVASPDLIRLGDVAGDLIRTCSRKLQHHEVYLQHGVAHASRWRQRHTRRTTSKSNSSNFHYMHTQGYEDV